MARPRKEVGVETVAFDAERASAALAALATKLDKLPSESVAPVEGDLGPVLNAARLAHGRLQGSREQWLTSLPQLPIEALDELDELAHATWYADLVVRHAEGATTSDDIESEATELREGLLIGAEALAHRHLLDRDTVASIRKGPVNLARDLTLLGGLFASEWSKVAGKTAVEKKEFERASKLGSELALVNAARGFASGASAHDPSEVRARVYALLVQAYETCRRAAVYLRWAEGDADAVIPPLAKKRPAKKTKADDSTETYANGSAPMEATSE